MQTELSYSAFESRYRDKQYIGSGGFAKVYKVFDHAKNHYVALKVADVRPEWDKFTLRNEVELVNKLPRHRNIARYDACYRFNTGFTGEMDFAVLRFYEYGNLEQFLKKQELTAEDKKLIIHGILEGIKFLHDSNVIHRDMKSQNILLHREDGIWTPKITDFGLSREVLNDGTVTNSAIGVSYAYAAPEQIQNRRIYRNVDLWAIGVIVYRIIAGELPFKGRSGGDDRSSQSQLELSRKIVNLELPEKLESLIEPYRSIIKKCLVYDPKERAQSASELIDLLIKGVVQFAPITNSNIPNTERQEIVENSIKEMNINDLKQEIDELKTKSGTENSGNDSASSKFKHVNIEDSKEGINLEEIIEPEQVNEKLKRFKPRSGARKFPIKLLILIPVVIVVIIGAMKIVNTGKKQAALVQEIPIDSPENIDGMSDELFDKYKKELNSKIDRPLVFLELTSSINRNKLSFDYRWELLLAQYESLSNGKLRDIANRLNAAAEVAIRKGYSSEMLADINSYDDEIFSKFKNNTFGQSVWNMIVETLEKNTQK